MTAVVRSGREGRETSRWEERHTQRRKIHTHTQRERERERERESVREREREGERGGTGVLTGRGATSRLRLLLEEFTFWILLSGEHRRLLHRHFHKPDEPEKPFGWDSVFKLLTDRPQQKRPCWPSTSFREVMPGRCTAVRQNPRVTHTAVYHLQTSR